MKSRQGHDENSSMKLQKLEIPSAILQGKILEKSARPCASASYLRFDMGNALCIFQNKCRQGQVVPEKLLTQFAILKYQMADTGSAASTEQKEGISVAIVHYNMEAYGEGRKRLPNEASMSACT